MRHETAEIAGSRTQIDYKVELAYEVVAPTDFVFNVQAAQTAQQHVSRESIVLEPDAEFESQTEPVYGNRLIRTHAEAGWFRLRYAGSVQIAHYMAEPARVVQVPIAELPASVLHFMMPSRYCQTDQVQALAWREFGHIPPGYAQAFAVAQWVGARTRFQVGTSGIGTSCLETLDNGVGVCRDFAHLTIAILRALNYPARFVTGVDYGADPALGPPDFHAYAEAFIGERWYLFDATGISPLTGLIRIGTGRDAADVSFATMFGNVRSGMPIVSFSAVDDPARGIALPAPTTLAVSTALA
ncbi:MAG TPA: transglutaminase family protein [Casimicrobiaceae bacterium]|nr:transglutaminase family protein [Casimicrobiaceae bacterium]